MSEPMTSRTDPSRHADPADADTAADRGLQQALRALPVPTAPARLEALQARVLAQWQAAHAEATRPLLSGPGLVRWRVGGSALRRRWVLGSGMALGGAALVLGLWLQQPDPALEELLQPDVLSQMAVGEM